MGGDEAPRPVQSPGYPISTTQIVLGPLAEAVAAALAVRSRPAESWFYPPSLGFGTGMGEQALPAFADRRCLRL